ncbi:MAG: DUF115 domain-containing protein [Phycisphaerales bacterium]|nr:DUF115 domain-containing protein [Phycisphaerales bacterium]
MSLGEPTTSNEFHASAALDPLGVDLGVFFGDAAGAVHKPELPPIIPARALTLPAGACVYAPSAAQREATLDKNLRAMPAQAIRTIRKIAQATPRQDVVFVRTGEGLLSAILQEGSVPRQLASLHRPGAEAATLTKHLDVTAAGATVALGFGLGYHVAEVARRYGKMGVVLAFEPDVSLLRAVFEHVDHSEWLSLRNCVIVTEPDDSGEITASITGAEGIFMVGTRMLEHPPSKARLGDRGERFGKSLAAAMRAVRTSIVTTLVQVDTTVRNLLGNLESYANAPGIEDLKGIASGKPAIVVSAGPSLRRNIELLLRPGVRDRFVIIAVQTVLKNLLARGIRPHFVTALDHAAISKRFYEGLTAADVEGVTLVVEPKASPAIFEAWPGAIRCPGERILDSILTDGADEATQKAFTRERGELRPGATVAHLAYYLARHMGADPVVFIGQDLGFTDGQYYAAGAAIHQVWSGELNSFRTLEMLEWERIVRERSMLHRLRDHLGRPCYSDEQMTTYLVQFERDFGEDLAKGLRVIDATEGGIAKRHATAMPLLEAIETFGTNATQSLPGVSRSVSDSRRRSLLLERVRQVRAEIWRVGEISRATGRTLQEVITHHADQHRVNNLIGAIETHAAEVTKIEPAYALVQHLNQTGILNRFKADRAIELNTTLSPLERQKRQAERDLKNVSWLADSADELGSMFDGVIARLSGGKASVSVSGSPALSKRIESAAAEVGIVHAERRVDAAIIVDTEFGGLGTPRDLSRPIHAGLNALQMTVARVSRSQRISHLTLFTNSVTQTKALLGDAARGKSIGPKIEFVEVPAEQLRARHRGVRAARLCASACWRGGVANVSVFDEVFPPAALAGLFTRTNRQPPQGLIPINADWCLVDPRLLDAMVDRYAAPGETHRMVFAHATPGLTACLLDQALIEDFATKSGEAGPLASLGTVLSYLPIAPQADPITRPACVGTDHVVRDLARRLIADRPETLAWIGEVCKGLGDRWLEADASAIARRAGELAQPVVPEQIRVELVRAVRPRDPVQLLDLAVLESALRACVATVDPRHTCLSFDLGDALKHPAAAKAIELARALGFAAVHVRTELHTDEACDTLLATRPDVISVDLHADTPETYRLVRGLDQHEAVVGRIERLLAARPSLAGGLVDQWIVPRITRRDAVYAEIESFYDRWIMKAGAAVIDPLPAAVAGERIEPLPLPAGAAARLAASQWRVDVQGQLHRPPADATEQAS